MFAITGSLIALKKGYDPVGVAIITIISGAGGGIIRDSIFLDKKPSAITDWRYSAVLLVAIIVVFLARSVLKTRPIGLLIINVEALGIGINSVYGTQKSIGLGLSIFSAIIVGFINGVGGRLLRDIVMGRKRKNLIPGRMFGVASFFSVGLYLIMSRLLKLEFDLCAWCAIIFAYCIRMIAVKFDIKTKALIDYYDPSEKIVHKVSGAFDLGFDKIKKRPVLRLPKKEQKDQ